MWTWVRDLDRILRGEATRLAELRDETIATRVGGLSAAILVLGAIYGVCMGSFALINGDQTAERLGQLVACMVKVPALFFLTLLVTFPSLYVFNALVGTRLTLPAMLRLLLASLGVNLAVLASLGPIVAFFSASTTTAGYGFMVILNVLVFSVSGVLGLSFLLQTLHRLSVAPRASAPRPAEGRADGESAAIEPVETVPAEEPGGTETVEAVLAEEPGPLEPVEGYVLGRHVKEVFGCWVIVFALVGAQMGWVLRPFIGSPNMPFAWFRPRGSNFFQAVLDTVTSLLF